MSFLQTVLLIASILAGECGPLGTSCELAVSRTVANRLVDSRWSGSLEGVLDAYYGRGVPTETSLSFAALLVLTPGMLVDGFCFFVYSDADRLLQGWPVGDQVLCGDDGLCLHFSKELKEFTK